MNYYKVVRADNGEFLADISGPVPSRGTQIFFLEQDGKTVRTGTVTDVRFYAKQRLGSMALGEFCSAEVAVSRWQKGETDSTDSWRTEY